MIKENVLKIKDEMIQEIINLVRYESVSKKSDNKEKPFGEECKKSLEHILELGKKLGFNTKNIDGYCGYIEFGEGKELLGIIGHLDVVPATKEDGWTKDPYQAEIINNKLYGRGTSDDKGPVISCLYAMKIANSLKQLNKRVRLIIGLNEEQDWECIERYKQTEELPTISFSPDANFPCIYAEKGIITLTIENDFNLDDEILEFTTGNNAINVVPKTAHIIIKTNNPNKFIEEKDIIVEKNEDTIKITATGISSHAAFPTLGDNAATKLLKYINKIYKNKFLTKLEELDFYNLENPLYLGGDSLTDESGTLTSNIGIINYENNKLIIKTNLRVPIKTSFAKLKNICNRSIDSIKYYFEGENEGLYVSKDSYLVKTLTRIFNETTNMNEEAIAIGGGTYARAFNNCVSFGMTFPNEEELCHQVNENIDIDNLLLATEIYTKAIIELAS